MSVTGLSLSSQALVNFSSKQSEPVQLEPRIAKNLKYLQLARQRFNEAILSCSVDLKSKNFEVLTQGQISLQLQINTIKEKIASPSSDVFWRPTAEIFDQANIFAAAKSIQCDLFTNFLDCLYFQHFQLTRLNDLMEENADIERLHKCMKLLPQTILDRLYLAVWMHHRLPYAANYGKKALLENPFLLLEIKDPYFFQNCRHVVEQLICVTEEEITLEECRHCIQSLQYFNDTLQTETPALDSSSAFDFFHRMPEPIKNKFNELIKIDDLEKNPKLLFDSKNKTLFPVLISLIQELIFYFRDEHSDLLQKHELHQKEVFMELFQSRHIPHKSLKRIFQMMPPKVKQEIPQPPYFGHGVNFELHKHLGSHLTPDGAIFRVLAPNAQKVSLVLTAYGYDEHFLPMKKTTSSGIWEYHAKWVKPGRTYYYEIETKYAEKIRKADPFARGFIAYDTPFRHESVVRDNNAYLWNDYAWMQRREKMHLKPQPISIYEMHISSWRKNDKNSFSYRDLANEHNPLSLVNYCKEMGYTHVQFMGLMEHPQEISWGYQVTGYFAPNHKLGTLDDFKFMVDKFHQNHIGVFLDFVPAHFALDSFALPFFDGTALYEHPDPKRGEHMTWGTKIFNYENEDVRNFLISSLACWSEYHIDGFRGDGISSMLYLDYDRDEWLPNHKNGNVNLGAKQCIRDMNQVIHEHFPGVILMAEESTGFPKMTYPTKEKGFAFDAKWAMGWEYDCIKFLSYDYPERSAHFHELVHTVEKCEMQENIILALSHDEVAHGKKCIPDKMPGDLWKKYANTRLLFGYQFCHPGRKLTFMGNDIGQREEWSFRLLRSCKNHKEAMLEAVQWDATNDAIHAQTARFARGIQQMFKDLNTIYRKHPPLWENDGSPGELSWIRADDSKNQVISYHRLDKAGNQLACVHNFSPNAIADYVIAFPDESYAPKIQKLVKMREIFNSDDARYGGSGLLNSNIQIIKEGQKQVIGFKILLPALATIIIEETFAP